MQRLDVRLLGGFDVAVDGRPVAADAWPSRRAADLVKVLALAERGRMARDQVVELLWPKLGADAGVANLHKAAHHARRALGEAGAVVLGGGEVRLAPKARVSCDVARFEAGGDPDLYAGDLLPGDRFEEWAQEPRERLRAIYLDALRAAGRLQELVASEPTDEPAQRELIGAALRAGDRPGALRRYRELARAMAQLGLRPGEQTRALHSELTRGPAARAPLTATSPLVGRHAELERALQAWRAARDGAGGALLIAGESGIGKTRLCEEILARAARDGSATLRGAAGAEGAAPYAPVTEALDRLLLERPDLVAQLTDAARAELGRLSTASPDTPPALGPEPERQRILSAAGQLIAAAAREHGAVVLLEDLHAADEATIALALFLARAARFQRVLVIVSFRDAELAPALARLRASLLDQRAATAIELAALPEPAARELIGNVAGRAPRAQTSETIWELAHGHPFFTEELAAAIRPDGGVEIPGRLYEVLHARLNRLAPDVRDALARLAVAGQSFSLDELAALAGEREEALLAALEAAFGAEVIAEAPGGYRFRHALVREALVRGLPRRRIVAAHGEAAQRLAGAGGEPARIAHHLLAAGRPRDAVPWLARAAREAAMVAAYSDALALADRALEAGAEPPQRAELLALRADLLLATGDPAAPLAYAEALAAAPGEARVGLALKRVRAFINAGDVAAAAAAVDGISPRDEAERARLLLARGMIAWFCGRPEEARTAGAQAREIAIRTELGRETTEATQLQAAVAHADGEWAGHLQAELARTQGLPDLETTFFDGHLCIAGYVLASGGPYDRLMASAAELRASARRAGARRVEGFAALVYGEAALLSGDVASAAEQLPQAVELHREVGASSGEALSRLRLAEAELAAGHRGRCEQLLEQALAIARFSPLADHVLYLVYAAMLRTAPAPDAALALLDQAQTSLEASRACFFCPVALTVAGAIACATAGQTERARALLAASEQRAGLWGSGTWPAAVHEAAGEISIAEGRAEHAATELRDAMQRFARAGQPLNEARVAARLAALR